ncbi:hypothetical protein AERO8C_50533 [Aeromonas veronii]|uniref:Uncharacterized protein n=1 Tax=Aeromonas veronii TaxID=654 RepID=A0A653L9H1_AERVE|nr:hypothetical protein AERO8C_50533 [Aeromonas veronii]
MKINIIGIPLRRVRLIIIKSICSSRQVDIQRVNIEYAAPSLSQNAGLAGTAGHRLHCPGHR